MASAITINSNVSALTAQRRLEQSTSRLQQCFARLSSGLRINKASDDAAGLAIASGLTTDRRVFNQGVRNLNDGISVSTFGQATSYATESTSSYSTALGDLNHDGVLDLVTAGIADGSDGYATIRLGRGDGSFGAPLSYATETDSSMAAALGDLNGDGVLDLVTAGASDAPTDGYATVRLGQGDGTFAQATSYATDGYLSSAFVLGDLNGDGVLDLVTAGYTDPACHGYATVRLGQGDGTFSSATSYAAENVKTFATVLGDLNGDGVLDLATAGETDGFNAYATVQCALTQDGTAPLLPFDLSTMAGARQALPVFKRKLEQLSAQRGGIGAFQARIGVAINTTHVAVENFAAAESQIMDADVADESAQLVRTRILQQAGAAVLAKANREPELALALLGAI